MTDGKFFLEHSKIFFPDFWRFFGIFSIKLAILNKNPFFHHFSQSHINWLRCRIPMIFFLGRITMLKRCLKNFGKKIRVKTFFFRDFWEKIFIDIELFSIFTQMTIEISDPRSTFKRSNRLNIVPKLPKMFF